MKSKELELLFINTETGQYETYMNNGYFDRESGEWETSIKVGNSGINKENAERLSQESKGWVLVLRDNMKEKIVSSGIIKSSDIIDEELLFRCDDPERVGVDELPPDVRHRVREE